MNLRAFIYVHGPKQIQTRRFSFGLTIKTSLTDVSYKKASAYKMVSVLKLRPIIGLARRCPRHFSTMSDSYYSEEHKAMQASLKKIIDNDINPHVDQWEQEGNYPAHQVFKKLGNAGLLGATKPEEFGGLGLDFKLSLIHI